MRRRLAAALRSFADWLEEKPEPPILYDAVPQTVVLGRSALKRAVDHLEQLNDAGVTSEATGAERTLSGIDRPDGQHEAGVTSASPSIRECGCTKSDAWQCAKDRGLRALSCECPCHRSGAVNTIAAVANIEPVILERKRKRKKKLASVK